MAIWDSNKFMKKMMDIVPRGTVLAEQSKKQKTRKRKTRDRMNEKAKERLIQKERRIANKRARKLTSFPPRRKGTFLLRVEIL